MILNKLISKNLVTNVRAAKRRHRRRFDHAPISWEQVVLEARKFRAVFKCHEEADRIFVYRVLAASQWNLPPRCVWSALEAVHQIQPRSPIRYFHVVLRDECEKAGVDLYRAIRGVQVPTTLPTLQPAKPRTTPVSDDAMRLRGDELQKEIP
jgi:hypothetical protein